MAEHMPDSAPTMECVHCGADVDLPLRNLHGRDDYWLFDGEKLTCETCSAANQVMLDEEAEDPGDRCYFADCDDDCQVCDAAEGGQAG